MAGLASIWYPAPTPNGFTEWTLSHVAHHQAIIDAAAQVKNVRLLLYQIYPFNNQDPEGWLLQHQSQHDDMNQLYGVNGSDLSTLDFSNKRDVDAWMLIHATEHRDVAQASGLPI